jgi:two-component system cell cycle response regulator
MPARILLIEDNEPNLELMAYVLTAYGHTVFETQDGEEGVDAALRELPDLILTDMQMPKMDGYGVLRALRKDPRFQNRPIVAVTAFAMRDDRDRALAAGFDGYIVKPIMPEEFVGQVEEFLDPSKRSGPRSEPASEWHGPATLPFHTTILAVDNSPVNLSLLESTLGPLGYMVVTAATAQEALTIAKKNPPDLILSDLHMPDLDGYEFFKVVQTDPSLKLIPFAIISSTIWPDDDLTRAIGMGVRTFIRRPIDPDCLVKEVEALRLRPPAASAAHPDSTEPRGT